MKVSISGFPQNGTGYDTEERFRDMSAKAVSDAIRRCGLKDVPREIAIAFHSNDRGPANAVGSGALSQRRILSRDSLSIDGVRTDEPDFSRLLSNPRVNAGLLCVQPATLERIQHAIDRMRVRSLVYEKWGLSQLDPFPRTTLNLSGPPGTGKTLTGHYIAQALGKQIIEISYGDIASKYLGQSARNLTALYEFAQREDAIIFIDEAEAFFSTRIEEISDAADHAINTMRNQLLTLVEKTPVFSIVASNLAGSYDRAFESRLTTIHFPLPDQPLRERIWRAHLPASLPVTEDVTPDRLAERFTDLNGRQIARAVIEAAHRAAIQGQCALRMQDFDWAVSLVTEPLVRRA